MNIAIIGAGLIGKRRAQYAREYGDEVVAAYDPNTDAAKETGADAVSTPEEAIEAADIVVVATPNKFLLPNTRLVFEAGKHVLVEKPMGRNINEATEFVNLQEAHPDQVIKIGFNHRYHPGIAETHKLVQDGAIGNIKYIRAVYGHGGRPGYEKEWRGDSELAGGGELMDQGVHLIDIICWFSSAPQWAFAQGRAYEWSGNLEDNGFFMLGWENKNIAHVHASCTQWKNRFHFEVYGTKGAVEINGLGGSYGQETLTVYKRKPEGGVPKIETKTYPDEDISWAAEWKDFREAIDNKTQPMSNPAESFSVMQTLDAVYKSCESGNKENI